MPLFFRFKTRLKCSERDRNDPERVRQTIIEIAKALEEEEANRALAEEMDPNRRPGSLEQRYDN